MSKSKDIRKEKKTPAKPATKPAGKAGMQSSPIGAVSAAGKKSTGPTRKM